MMKTSTSRVILIASVALMASCLPALADFCTQCGVKLPDNARFCPKCGAKVVDIPGGSSSRPPSRVERPPPRRRVVEAPPPPAEEEDDSLATISIRQTYPTKQDSRGQWQISLDKIDIREPTFVAIKEQFEKLMWGKLIEEHHQEYFFEKFLILDRRGKLNFAYQAIRVYDKGGARRMQSKPGSDDTAYWHNDVDDKVYRLKIEDKTIKITLSEGDS